MATQPELELKIVKPDLRTVVKFVQVGLTVLTARALTWAAMLITALLFAYTLYEPNALRLATSTIFGLLVFWRVTWSEKSQQPQQGETNG